MLPKARHKRPNNSLTELNVLGLNMFLNSFQVQNDTILLALTILTTQRTNEYLIESYHTLNIKVVNFIT